MRLLTGCDAVTPRITTTAVPSTSAPIQAAWGEQYLPARGDGTATLPGPVLIGEDGQDVAVVLQQPDLLVGHVRLVAAEGAADDAGGRVLHNLLQAFGADAVEAAQHLGLAGACVITVVANLTLQLLHGVDQRLAALVRHQVQLLQLSVHPERGKGGRNAQTARNAGADAAALTRNGESKCSKASPCTDSTAAAGKVLSLIQDLYDFFSSVKIVNVIFRLLFVIVHIIAHKKWGKNNDLRH